MRSVGLLLSLLVTLLCSQASAVQNLAISTPLVSFARPYDTTTYGIGDLVANSTLAASVVPMAWNIANPQSSGSYIRRANIRKTSTGVVAPNFRLHLYTTVPVPSVGDNVALATTGTAGWFCDIDVNMFTTTPASDGNFGAGTPSSGAECEVLPTASTIYGLLEARGAYVPGTGEIFTVGLEVYTPGAAGGGTVASAPSWVTPGAVLDYDFANQRYWNSGASTALNVTRATAATCTSSNGALTYVTTTLPCITDRGLQVWQASTNLLLQSQFAATWSATRSTLTANAVTSPDATVDAATLIEDATATSTHLTTQAITKAASALSYTFSVYGKSSSTRRIDMQLDDNAGNGAIMSCDLAGQQVGVAGAGVGVAFTTITSAVEAYSNGWTRCRLTATTNTATDLNAVVFLDNGTGTAAVSNSYSGDGASGATIFGAQLEQNTALVVPTPYIPTTVASATRNQDSIAIAGFPVSNGTYTVFAQGVPRSATTFTGTQDLLQIDDGTNQNRTFIFRSLSTALPAATVAYAGSATGLSSANLNASVAQAIGASGKYIVAVSNSSQAASYGGRVPVTGSQSGVMQPPVVIRAGTSNTPSIPWNGEIQRITLWPTQLPTNTLQALTQ